MTDDKMIAVYRAKPVADMDREELTEAFDWLAKRLGELESIRERELRVLDRLAQILERLAQMEA